jgi:multicomponent Na+:H+ antiporter subunit A
MLLTVLAAFAAAAAAPAVHRLTGRAGAFVLALVPAALAIYFLNLGEASLIVERIDWAPDLGIYLSFSLDGLSRLFALLITGIGTLILIYAGPYMAPHPHGARLSGWLLAFLGSMLGLVLAENVITLFVFWELTSLTSYMLIGFDHERPRARAAALQALLVTGTGGLAMLAGLVLMGQAAGSYDITLLVARADLVRADPTYTVAVILILLGAFTKSAQFPFHFWLPNAMEAPTPVSAYLHSSTMVKAGVYLLARLTPVLGGTALWFWSVSLVGAITMVVAAVFALGQTEFKRILAYSTVSTLGLITMCLGIGTDEAVLAAVAVLLVHACYKGAMFLVAGLVMHGTHKTDVREVGGLGAAMPLTAVAAGLAALSMAGLPPFAGFISKELTIEAVLHAPSATWIFTAGVWVTAALSVALAGIVGLGPFVGPRDRHAHEGSPAMCAGPLILGGLGAALGLAPQWLTDPLVHPAATAILHDPNASHAPLALWHGLTPALIVSLAAIAVGVGLYVGRDRCRAVLAPWPDALNGSAAYGRALAGVQQFAGALTRVIQDGYLRHYLLATIAAMVALIGLGLAGAGVTLPSGWADLRVYEAALVVVIGLAAVAAIQARSRLGAVAALGVVGYGVALIFVQFGAPDLAMTQFAIETLSVLLLVFAFYRLPPKIPGPDGAGRARDAAVAIGGGVLMTLLVALALDVQLKPSISDFYVKGSVPEAHGHNVVNVILVDFRGLDTMGEITVLGIAAIGVFALLRFRDRREGER